MIYKVRNICQITENSSNMHFLVHRLNALSLSLKAAFSVGNAVLNPCFPVTSILMVHT